MGDDNLLTAEDFVLGGTRPGKESVGNLSEQERSSFCLGGGWATMVVGALDSRGEGVALTSERIDTILEKEGHL